MKKWAPLLAIAALLMPANAQASSVDELIAEYLKAGSSIVDMVNSRSVVASKVEKKVIQLTKISVELSNRYKKVHPESTLR